MAQDILPKNIADFLKKNVEIVRFKENGCVVWMSIGQGGVVSLRPNQKVNRQSRSKHVKYTELEY